MKTESLSERFVQETEKFLRFWLRRKGVTPGSEPLLSDEPLTVEDFDNAKVIETTGYEVKS